MENQISPTPKKQSKVSFSFSEAVTEMLSDNRVRRIEWPEGEYGFIGGDGFLMIKKADGVYIWKLHKTDMLETDWEVINKTN